MHVTLLGLCRGRGGNLPRTAFEPHFTYLRQCMSREDFQTSPKQSSGGVSPIYNRQCLLKTGLISLFKHSILNISIIFFFTIKVRALNFVDFVEIVFVFHFDLRNTEILETFFLSPATFNSIFEILYSFKSLELVNKEIYVNA